MKIVINGVYRDKQGNKARWDGNDFYTVELTGLRNKIVHAPDFTPYKVLYYGRTEEYLKTAELVVGGLYHCYARNFKYGIWTGRNFEYMRYKYVQRFLDYEEHWDTDPHFGTVQPIERII